MIKIARRTRLNNIKFLQGQSNSLTYLNAQILLFANKIIGKNHKESLIYILRTVLPRYGKPQGNSLRNQILRQFAQRAQ